MGLREIEGRTGLKFSTVRSILRSRVYLGEVPHNGQWFPGRHEPLVTPEEVAAANRASFPAGAAGGTCCRAACAAGCVASVCPSTKTARVACSTAAATGARDVANRLGRTSGS